jgi:hypothetical protein
VNWIVTHIGMLAMLPGTLPVVLAALAGAGAAFGVNWLIGAGVRQDDGER